MHISVWINHNKTLSEWKWIIHPSRIGQEIKSYGRKTLNKWRDLLALAWEITIPIRCTTITAIFIGLKYMYAKQINIYVQNE